MDKKITILGAGSSGMATAAYLELEGWEVALWDIPEQAEDFAVIERQGGILLRGVGGKTGCALPHQMTCDIAQALAYARRVVVCVSSARHAQVARLVAPAARADQVFLLSPGNFGAFLFRKELDAAGKPGCLVAELSGNLWACRRTAPGEALIATPIKPMKAAALPARDTPAVAEAFRGIFTLDAAANVLEASLNSPNVVSHVAGAVLNAVGIERKGEDFALFLDGLGESVIRCFGILETERNAVLEKLGLAVYNPSSETHMRRLMDRGNHPELECFRKLDGPSSFDHRYVSEDAACGVAMLVSLGRQYGTPTPLSHAFLVVAGAINGADYMATGRTLENLGLSGLPLEELGERL